jgi:hypothetical protein
MTKSELNKLHELSTKLLGERLKELDEQYPESDIYDLDSEELYDLDDGDRLCEGLDIVIGVVENIRGEDDEPTKPTLEEIKRVLQYLDEEMLVEGTFKEVCEYVNQLKDD